MLLAQTTLDAKGSLTQIHTQALTDTSTYKACSVNVVTKCEVLLYEKWQSGAEEKLCTTS